MRSYPSALLGLLLAIGCGAPKGSADSRGGPEYSRLENVPSTSPTDAQAARASHRIQHVFVIVLENRDWRSIEGSASAPYLNGLLAQGAFAANYHGPNNIHPSEPNYIWMEAGNNLAILDDDDPVLNHRTTKVHLTRQLDDAHISWKSYQEGIGGEVCPLGSNSAGRYGAKHNPMIFFDDMTDGGDKNSQHCMAHVRPYSELETALANDDVAAYDFITPDLCHDMHDVGGCETGDPIKNGDLWLSREVPKILGSKAFATSALFITWDENENSDQNIGMIALSPFAKKGYVNHVDYSHSSLLRSVQDIFGLRPYIRDAENANGLNDLFEQFP
ncbi:MAG: alkaline phosphatase family protein [Polyangiales bacterium]